MSKTLAVTALLMTILSASTIAQDAKTVIEDASLAMGAAGVSSIVYSGAAATGNFGQSRTISFGLASTTIKNYTRAIDFTQPASRATGDTLPPAVPGGPPPQPGKFDQTITPANTGWAQQLQIWVTPWGFLKGAAANNATTRAQKIGDIKYKPSRGVRRRRPRPDKAIASSATSARRTWSTASKPGWSIRSSATCTSR
jgi:hypothetical protein